jgi:hypothetical protein
MSSAGGLNESVTLPAFVGHETAHPVMNNMRRQKIAAAKSQMAMVRYCSSILLPLSDDVDDAHEAESGCDDVILKLWIER